MRTRSPQREEEKKVEEGKRRERVCQVSFGADRVQCKRKESSREHSRPLSKGCKSRRKYSKPYSITKIRDGGNTAIQSTKSVMRKANPIAFI